VMSKLSMLFLNAATLGVIVTVWWKMVRDKQP
jgi:hypothetical protein